MWRPQQYKRTGLKSGIDPATLNNSLAAGHIVYSVCPHLTPILSLRHLSYLSGVSYRFLRGIVARRQEDDYKIFRIKKYRSPQNNLFRIICVPEPRLMRAQRWINKNILKYGKTHPASVAYSSGCDIYKAAEPHCSCNWLIKLDIISFFESISEIRAYRAFRTLGYQPLVSFEMARICTRLGSLTNIRKQSQWWVHNNDYGVISEYLNDRIGHLPQGAPTSPVLSNLAVIDFDKEIQSIADDKGLIYTRYADDLCLSTIDSNFNRAHAGEVISKIYSAMPKFGFSPNRLKTRISPPGSRKVVLGLIVNGEKPKLSRDFRMKLRQHIYYIMHPEIGPSKHAEKRGFVSVWGLRNHVEGLIAHAQSIDELFAQSCKEKLRMANWPL